MRKLWVVEDDDNIREMLLYALENAGFEVRGFDSGEGVLGQLDLGAPAMVLLDIMLPGRDGISILKCMRENAAYRDISVIMITAKGGEVDRIRGLDLGADDYITKPFSVMEVLSRVKAVLRRCGEDSTSPDELRIGGIVLNRAKRHVEVKGEPVTLTYKEFELLMCLMVNAGIVLSRDKLLEQIWGFDYDGESRTVDMHIKTLRQKLGEAAGEIQTVRNVGYKIGG